MAILTQTIPWADFSDKHKHYIHNALKSRICVAGGGKADSYKRILGNSCGLWIATEINEHYDSDDSRESFLKVAFGRQAAALDPLVLWDLNPCNPNHRIYRDYIDHYAQTGLPGYLYEHFTMDDNLSISDARREEIKAQYDPDSIWYHRDILGERCADDGLVYPMFNKDFHVVPEVPRPYDKYYISCDYGTINPTSMGLWGRADGKWYRMREYYYDSRKEDGQRTDEEYYAELERLAGDLPIRGVIVDPSAASFLETIHRHGRFFGIKASNAVLDGIRDVAAQLQLGRLFICENCTDCIREFGLYRWDEKATVDRPVKENDHAMDDVRYFVHRVFAPDLFDF